MVARDHGAAHARVAGDERLVELAYGPEVQQHDAVGVGVEQVVGEVRVGLHEAELEELAEQQPLEPAAHVVAHVL